MTSGWVSSRRSSKVIRDGGVAPIAYTPPFQFELHAEMALETEGLTTKIQELEDQVAALKKDNTRLKNEMRFNLDQEK